MLKKGDAFLILIAGIIAGCFLLWSFLMGWNGLNLSGREETPKIAVVIHDGQRIAEINLEELSAPEYLRIEEGIKVVILAERGRIRFWEAECPDKTCVKTGWLSKNGDKAVCLPSRTIIRIEGEGQLDSISY
jgi:hypothetical protein